MKGNPDSYICDANKPSRLVSTKPRLALKYTTTNLEPDAAVGFQANYQFAMGKHYDFFFASVIPSCITQQRFHFAVVPFVHNRMKILEEYAIDCNAWIGHLHVAVASTGKNQLVHLNQSSSLL